MSKSWGLNIWIFFVVTLTLRHSLHLYEEKPMYWPTFKQKKGYIFGFVGFQVLHRCGRSEDIRWELWTMRKKGKFVMTKVRSMSWNKCVCFCQGFVDTHKGWSPTLVLWSLVLLLRLRWWEAIPRPTGLPQQYSSITRYLVCQARLSSKAVIWEPVPFKSMTFFFF